MAKTIVMPLSLAQDLFDLLNQTIEYDDLGEPIDSDHSALLENLFHLDALIKQAKNIRYSSFDTDRPGWVSFAERVQQQEDN